MYNKPYVTDLPFRGQICHKNRKEENPLEAYIPNQIVRSNSKNKMFNEMPQQMKQSPYNQKQLKQQNRPSILNQKHFQSFSKCAITQNSCCSDKQKTKAQITPICQKLFHDPESFELLKQFNLQNQYENMNEATFKPKDLQKQLNDINTIKNTNNIKKILQDKVFSKSLKKIDQTNNSNAKKNPIAKIKNQYDQIKIVTKYQKILQQYFRQKSHKNRIQRCQTKVSFENLPNLRLRHLNQEENKIEPEIQKNINENKANVKFIKQGKENVIRVSRTMSLNDDNKNCKPMKKSFSELRLHDTMKSEKQQQKSRLSSDRWLAMTFSQRQSKTVMNRKLKENIGQQANREKQIQHCTFKPVLTEFKQFGKEKGVQSYAKLYLSKIKRKF